MGWKWFRLARCATTAGLPTLTEGSLFWATDRKRINAHDGTSWREVAYRTDFPIGTLLFNDLDLTPSETFPAISRAVNNDIAVANWPLAVSLYRAVKTSIGGITDHAVTVSGSTITGSGATWDKLLALIQADALAAGWLSSGQSVSYVADYTTAAYQRCINISGTDYPITSVNLVAHTASVTGSPATGSQTAIVYTYRIAGSTTTARLRALPGFVSVAAGDVDGEVVEGWQKMDRSQGHAHYINGATTSGTAGPMTAGGQAVPQLAGASGGNFYGVVTDIYTDGTNGTPRIGKTTDPRTHGQRAYTWLGQYVA